MEMTKSHITHSSLQIKWNENLGLRIDPSFFFFIKMVYIRFNDISTQLILFFMRILL